MSNHDASDNVEFSTQEYWDRRYTNLVEGEDSFDWFKTYDELKPILDPLLPSNQATILMLGCGNSTLSTSLYRAGYTHITNLDYSAPLIAHMRAKATALGMHTMAWHVMDVTALAHPASLAVLDRDVRRFTTADAEADADADVAAAQPEGRGGNWDVIIDKGTMDAFMAEKGSVWDPSERVRTMVAAEVDGVLQLLKPGAVFLYLTFGQPHFRRPLLERPGRWDVEVVTIGDMFHYYLYVCRKHL